MNDNNANLNGNNIIGDVNIEQVNNKSTWITRLINDYLSIDGLLLITCSVIGILIGFYIISPFVDKYIIAYVFHRPGGFRSFILLTSAIGGSIISGIIISKLLIIIKYYTNYDRSIQ